MRTIKIIDTTIRDGQASLWAMNMRTSHMLPALPHLDAAGFDQMEFLAAGSRLKKFVRHLAEDPWDWIKLGARAAQKTQLRWHGYISKTSMSGFVPTEVGELLIRKVVDLGITYTRTGNNWNDFTEAGLEKERLERLGMTPVINVLYSESPRHTDEYFLDKTRQAADLRPWRLCFKDVGGLLTPERIRALLPRMIEVAGDIPWEFHGHCNNGLGPLNALEAANAGVRYIHTAVPPLANGNSQPSVFNVAGNLRALGYDVDLDLRPLHAVQEHFERVAEREGFPKGVPAEFDQRLYHHQIPGGMKSNLEHQLQLAGVADRLEETLEETGRVRADLGYPIMVTPLSQFVGSQAAINVIVGERYKQVSDAVIEYALGRHGGAEAIQAMDPDVRAKILERPRARELERREQPDPTLADLRQRSGKDISDEHLILRAIVGDDAVDVIRDAPKPVPLAPGGPPLVRLIRELAAGSHRHVSLSMSGLSVTMRKTEDHRPPRAPTRSPSLAASRRLGCADGADRMELTQDDVLQILKLLEATDVDYLEVQVGKLRLVASKSGVLPGQATAPTLTATPPAPEPAPAAPASSAAPLGDAARTGAPGAPTRADAADEEGLVAVPASVVGVFYVAREPGAPPFVEVGARVEADTTVGLVEVMKVFNSVTAGVAGEVVRILVGNGEFVEYGQSLFLVRPETPA